MFITRELRSLLNRQRILRIPRLRPLHQNVTLSPVPSDSFKWILLPETTVLRSAGSSEPSYMMAATPRCFTVAAWVFLGLMTWTTPFQRVAQLTANPWDGIIPVGLQWGNDPELTQEAFESGLKARELWINPVADHLRRSLGGHRPSWGWNGRMNG